MYSGSNTKLNLTTAQKNSILRLMKNTTTDKKYYRRLLAVLHKSNGTTFADIARNMVWVSGQFKDGYQQTSRWGTYGLEIKKISSTKSRITDEDREIMLSVLFNDPNIFGYIRNTWSLRSLANCLTEELDIPISFRHLQRILKERYRY